MLPLFRERVSSELASSLCTWSGKRFTNAQFDQLVLLCTSAVCQALPRGYAHEIERGIASQLEEPECPEDIEW